jgi:subtilisin family serine protease
MKIWHLISYLFLYFVSINCDYIIDNEQHKKKILKLEKKFIEDFPHASLIEKYFSVKYKFWKENIYGDGIKIGIVDSGVKGNFCNFKKIYNYSEGPEIDENGHGTYIASVYINN